MANILRVKARWQGFVGAPGYSVFHFKDIDGSLGPTDTSDIAGQVRSFYDTIKAHLAPPVTIQVMSDVEVINEADGKMTDILTAGVIAPVTSTGAAGTGYSAPSGAVVTWRTAGVRNGRRVQGKTFLVPLISTAYQADGSINSVALQAIETASLALSANSTSAPDFGVYARPIKESLIPLRAAQDGVFHTATGYRVPDMAAILRSRRD